MHDKETWGIAYYIATHSGLDVSAGVRAGCYQHRYYFFFSIVTDTGIARFLSDIELFLALSWSCVERCIDFLSGQFSKLGSLTKGAVPCWKPKKGPPIWRTTHMSMGLFTGF